MSGSGRSYTKRKKRELCDCGIPLKNQQVWYCSNQCRDSYSHLNLLDHSNNTESIKEPYERNKQQVIEFLATIQKRKEELDSPELQTIRQYTPEDDSPEAERRLREAICPDPTGIFERLEWRCT